jgi:hypothetical protein
MGLFDIFSSKDAEDAAQARIAGLNAGYKSATGAVNTGLANATNYYNQALAPFATLAGTANKAYGSYADALGLNGAEGTARAKAAFASSPGYQYQVDQAIENADRGAAARGTLNSGGQRANEIGIASNLANQNWSNYLGSFAPYLSQAPTLAQGQAGVLSSLGGMNYDAGKTNANYGWQQQTGIGDANAAADMAKYNASGNIWGALFNGAKLASGALGGGFGNLFGGGAAGSGDPLTTGYMPGYGYYPMY